MTQLPEKSIFIVPEKRGAIRPLDWITGHSNRRAVKFSILLSIVEDVFDLVAHNKTIVGVDRGIPGIEDAMNVLAKENPIGLSVLASFSVRTNVRGIQRR